MDKDKTFVMVHKIKREFANLFKLLNELLNVAIDKQDYSNFLFLVYAMLSEAVKFLEDAKK